MDVRLRDTYKATEDNKHPNKAAIAPHLRQLVQKKIKKEWKTIRMNGL